MKFNTCILLFVAFAFLSTARAAPPCEFENTGQRRISGSNPKDFECIKLLADSGEEFYEYYLGLILIGQMVGPQDFPQGLAMLKRVALRNNKFSNDAMRFIGYAYRDSEAPIRNAELAYQWLYLASKRKTNPDDTFPLPDEALNAEIGLERRLELEKSAPKLLQDR